jgi:hypothetical protein
VISLRCFSPLLLLAAPASASSACLSYTERVRLEGVLERKTFPGPPNFESIVGGDRRQTSWLLRLARPVCVDEDKTDNAGINQAVPKLLLIQLVLKPDQFKTERKRLGRRVVLSGMLFGQITGYHRTPALLSEVRFEK